MEHTLSALAYPKKHMAVSPEQARMVRFSDEISKVGYDQMKEIVRIPWDRPVDYYLRR